MVAADWRTYHNRKKSRLRSTRKLLIPKRRDVRVVEGARLESDCGEAHRTTPEHLVAQSMQRVGTLTCRSMSLRISRHCSRSRTDVTQFLHNFRFDLSAQAGGWTTRSSASRLTRCAPLAAVRLASGRRFDLVVRTTIPTNPEGIPGYARVPGCVIHSQRLDCLSSRAQVPVVG